METNNEKIMIPVMTYAGQVEEDECIFIAKDKIGLLLNKDKRMLLGWLNFFNKDGKYDETIKLIETAERPDHIIIDGKRFDIVQENKGCVTVKWSEEYKPMEIDND